MANTALVTGITGQDGHYLTAILRARGYDVVGTSHRVSGSLATKGGLPVEVLRIDLTSQRDLDELVATKRPCQIYNLAARASSAQLFDAPLESAEVNGLAVMRLLEAIRKHSPETRFVQASSSEVFSGSATTRQTEDTPYAPTNAYGAAKAFGDHCVRAYRATHGLHASSAILYPHESELRDPHFLVRKVTRGAARIALGLENTLTLGDLSAKRDWGAAESHMEALVSMALLPEPDDFLVGTGEVHSIEDVCRLSFEYLGLNYKEYVRVDANLRRLPEAGVRCAESSKLKQRTGWLPKESFSTMIEKLIKHALDEFQDCAPGA